MSTMLRLDMIHYYQHLTAADAASFCRLRIYDTGAGPVVILSELADNPGISVTNAAEELATEIAWGHALDPETTIWLEHYGAFSYRDGRREETFDRVTFSWQNRTATAAQWRRLTDEELAAILPDDEGRWRHE